MTSITFIDPTGSRKTVEANNGISVMQAARDNGVEGLPAECGGCLSCATCHAYIAEEWVDQISPASNDEQAMLECATDVRSNSRLTCQIPITEALNGLVVEIPAVQ